MNAGPSGGPARGTEREHMTQRKLHWPPARSGPAGEYGSARVRRLCRQHRIFPRPGESRSASLMLRLSAARSVVLMIDRPRQPDEVGPEVLPPFAVPDVVLDLPQRQVHLLKLPGQRAQPVRRRSVRSRTKVQMLQLLPDVRQLAGSVIERAFISRIVILSISSPAGTSIRIFAPLPDDALSSRSAALMLRSGMRGRTVPGGIRPGRDDAAPPNCSSIRVWTSTSSPESVAGRFRQNRNAAGCVELFHVVEHAGADPGHVVLPLSPAVQVQACLHMQHIGRAVQVMALPLGGIGRHLLGPDRSRPKARWTAARAVRREHSSDRWARCPRTRIFPR